MRRILKIFLFVFFFSGITLPVSAQSTQSVTSFTLINADTDQPIAGFDPLPNGATLNLSTLPTANLNVRANTSPSLVGSVRFALDGNANYRTESTAPYTLAGDSNGDYFAWTPATGSHTLTATPFTATGATGTAGTALTINFTVTTSTGPTPTPPPGADIPLPGQIIRDPADRRWFVYNRDTNSDGKLDSFFLAGAGDPEDFLYRGTRQTDGTRSGGDQGSLINAVTAASINGLYLQIVRSHGGDGAADHNPFVNSNPASGLDNELLNQWEGWFDQMEQNGIIAYLFLYDDSACIWSCGTDSVPAEEQQFITNIVNRFEHHTNIIWIVAEEYQEVNSIQRVKNIAAAIRQADNYDHPVAVHHATGDTTFDFPGDQNIQQFSLQASPTSVSTMHSQVVAAVQNVGGQYNVTMSEAHPYYLDLVATGNRTTLRQSNWAAALAGGYVMMYGVWVAGTPTPDMLSDLGRIRTFFEKTDITSMTTHDELIHGSTQYVLSNLQDRHILYTTAGTTAPGVKNISDGIYKFIWLDTVSGQEVTQTNVSVAAGNQTFTKPTGFGSEVVVSLEKTSSSPTPTPIIVFPGADWLQASPESQGLDSTKLNSAMTYLQSVSGGHGTTQVVMVRNGYLIWKGSDIDNMHNVWSVSKSFTGTVLGLLIDDGHVTLNTLAKDYLPVLSSQYSGVTLKHFTTQTTGYDGGGDQSGLPFTPTAPLFAPGTQYQYWDSSMNEFANVQTRIINQKYPSLNPKTMEQLFKQRIADPIGMNPNHWSWGDWGTTAGTDGFIVNGGAGNKSLGISITSRQLARFCYLFLNNGNWNGQQILSSNWVQQATSVQVPASLPSQYGIGSGEYGFNWWINGVRPNGARPWPNAPVRTYQAAGHNNNRCIVVPEWNMVITRLGIDDNTMDDAEMNVFLSKVGEAITASVPTPTPVPGDVNGDNQVTIQDMIVVLSNAGKNGQSRTQGDLDGNGKVNGIDSSVVLINF